MNYVVPKSHLKTFHKSLQSLSKVGAEVYFEPGEHKLQAKAINNRKTAFFVFSYDAGFFSSISGKIKHTDSNPFRCKLQLKSLLLAFHSVVNTEKTVESCVIEFKQDCYQVCITRNCRHEVCQRYTLPTLEHDTLKIDSNQRGNNYLVFSQKTLRDITSAFRQNLDEVIMTAQQDGLQLRSYVYSHEEKEQVNTTIAIEVEEFQEYHVEESTSLTFNLKELRSLMMFAELVSLPVKASFSDGGRPITFSIIQEPMFTVTYVLATMPDENSETIRLMNTPRPPSTMQRIPRTQEKVTSNGDNYQRHSTQNASMREPASLPLMTPIPPPVISVLPAPRQDESQDLEEDQQQGNHQNGDEDSDKESNVSRIVSDRSKRKRKSDIFEVDNIEESIVESPKISRVKKRPKLFEKCFEKTFNPALLQPGTKILAPDSDEEVDNQNKDQRRRRRLKR